MDKQHADVYCHKCGSHDTKPTSSEQMRTIDGEKRLSADMICSKCGHSWWSIHPAALSAARAMDKSRQDDHDAIRD